MNLKKAHLMAGDIADIDCVLLGVLGALRTNLEDKPLLGERIARCQDGGQPHPCNR